MTSRLRGHADCSQPRLQSTWPRSRVIIAVSFRLAFQIAPIKLEAKKALYAAYLLINQKATNDVACGVIQPLAQNPRSNKAYCSAILEGLYRPRKSQKRELPSAPAVALIQGKIFVNWIPNCFLLIRLRALLRKRLNLT